MGEAEKAPEQRLRWYQYRLAHLFVLVTVVAIICACGASYWHWYLRAGFEYRRAVAPIEAVGGYVNLELDADHCRRVEEIASVYFPSLADVDLQHLKTPLEALPNLKVVRLNGTQITDAGLANLREMTQLEGIGLSNTRIGDAGLQHLGELSNLTWLNLERTRVTDAGLEHLKGMTKLEDLDLSDTQVTDNGVKKLQQVLPNCRIWQ